MNTQILEEIGLTKTETNVYLALLELGGSSTGRIVDKSGASSSKIYEILDRLMQKGLVSFIIKSGIKYFEAASPERILDYVEEKEKTLRKQKNDLKNMLPELELKRTLSQYKSEATVYKGIKGVETAFYAALDLLKDGDEMLVTGVPKRSDALNRFFLRFGQERKKRNILMRALFNENAKDDAQIGAVFSEIKYMSQITPAAINIFNDRVLIFPETEENLLISIDSKEVAESFRVQFEMQWNQKIRVYEGAEGVRNALKESLDFGDYVGFAEGTKIVDVLGVEFFEWWQDEKVKRGIVSKLIMGTKYKNQFSVQRSVAQFKFVDGYENPGVTMIFKDKVLSLMLTGEPSAMIAENKVLADSNRVYFERFWNQDTSIVKGFDGLKHAITSFVDDLKENNEPYLAIGAGFGDGQKKYLDFFEEISKYRIKKKVDTKILFQQGMDSFIFNHRNKNDNAEVKFLPYKSKTPVSITTSKNKTLLIIQDKEPTTITIDNEHIGKSFIDYFNSMWNQDTSTTIGFSSVTAKFDQILESIKSGDEYYVLGASLELRDKKMNDWLDSFHKKRIIQKKKVKFLTTHEAYPLIKDCVIKSGDANFNLTAIKSLSPEFSAPFQINLWKGDRVWLTFWEKEMRCFEIISKDAYNTFKTYFDALWNQKSNVYEGFEGVKLLMTKMLDFGDYDVITEGGNNLYLVLGDDFFYSWQAKKKSLGLVNSRGILNSKYRNLKNVKASTVNFRYVDNLKSPTNSFIFKDKLVTIYFSDTPVGVLIDDVQAVKSHKEYFEFLWANAKK